MSLLEAFKQIKTADPDGPLFTAGATEKRRAQAVYDAWMKRLGRNGKFSEFYLITPALAEIILTKNDENRRLSPLGLRRLTADFKAGNMQVNGESIVIAATGELNDGQHRLRACIESGVPFETNIVIGVERSSRETLDQGIRRTPGQQLGMLGYKDPNNLGHAGRVFWQMKTFECVSGNPDHKPSWPAILETIEENPLLCETAYGHKAWKANLGGVGLHVAMRLWCINISGRPVADKFFDPLVSALGFRGKTDPAYKLHTALSQRDRLTEVERAAFIIKAWNAYRKGQPLRQLKFIVGEEFPKAE